MAEPQHPAPCPDCGTTIGPNHVGPHHAEGCPLWHAPSANAPSAREQAKHLTPEQEAERQRLLAEAREHELTADERRRQRAARKANQ